MYNGGEAADQMVSYAFKGGEVVLRLSGAAAKNLAVYLTALLKQGGPSEGKTTLKRMIADGKELTVQRIDTDQVNKRVVEALILAGAFDCTGANRAQLMAAYEAALDGASRSTLAVSVSDNGIGFDPERAPGVQQGHFGLSGIRDRIRGYNGMMTIVSALGRGAKVKIKLEFPENR